MRIGKTGAIRLEAPERRTLAEAAALCARVEKLADDVVLISAAKAAAVSSQQVLDALTVTEEE